MQIYCTILLKIIAAAVCIGVAVLIARFPPRQKTKF